MLRYFSLVAVAMLTFAASAEQFPSFTLHPGKVKPGGNPFDALSSASLCLSESNTCFALRSRSDQYGLTFYDEDPEALRFTSSSGEQFVLFDAHTAGGSGFAYGYALLRYRAGNLEDLLPLVETSNISDRALWDIPTLSTLPVFLTADFIWEDGAHYSNHRYKITAYVYRAGLNRYTKVSSFDTRARYPSADLSSRDYVHVLAAERQHIMQRLGTAAKPSRSSSTAAR